MNLHIMNEAFKRNYSNVLAESVEPSYREQLRKALVMRSMQIVANGGNNKALEVGLQAVIEEFFPDNAWWEVTDCNIFMDLISGTTPREVCDHIVDQMKSGIGESCDGCEEDDAVTESVDDSVDGFYAKMAKCKTKSEVEAIVRKAKGNPNADEAYQKWLKNHPETDENQIEEAVSNPERTMAKVNKNLSRPVDNDLVRDLALVIENDRDAYMRCLRPTISMMKKRVAKGSFDSTLAIKAFVNAVESSLKLPHFYQYHSYSMQNVGVPERYAVAQELLKRCMDEIEWEDADSANQSIQTN